jgi:O-acetylhomoserine (thiol)-lyase
MPGYSDPGFDTLALHAGAAPDPATGARAVPIHLSTSFVFESSDQAAALFNLERAGHVYSRISNPTNAVLEQRVSALEGGIGAITTASGQAALHLTIATLMGAGSHIVASTALVRRFAEPAALHLAPLRHRDQLRQTRRHRRLARRGAAQHPAVLRRDGGQSGPGRAGYRHRVAAIAHEAGVPLLVDSTLTTPWLLQAAGPWAPTWSTTRPPSSSVATAR